MAIVFHCGNVICEVRFGIFLRVGPGNCLATIGQELLSSKSQTPHFFFRRQLLINNVT